MVVYLCNSEVDVNVRLVDIFGKQERENLKVHQPIALIVHQLKLLCCIIGE